MVSVIVLAAGEARRFGSPKQLALLGDKTLLDHAVQRNRELGELMSASARTLRKVIVLGAHYDQLLPHVLMEDWSRVTYAEHWQRGMAESLKVGFDAAQQDALNAGLVLNGVVVCLIDQPLLQASSLLRLVLKGGALDEISCAAYDGSVGTPAYFPSNELRRFDVWYEHLRTVDQTTGGAKRFIASRPHHAMSLGEELDDIDTKEDLARLKNRLAQD